MIAIVVAPEDLIVGSFYDWLERIDYKVYRQPPEETGDLYRLTWYIEDLMKGVDTVFFLDGYENDVAGKVMWFLCQELKIPMMYDKGEVSHEESND